MNITIRKAEGKDALCIIEAKRKIAQIPGFFVLNQRNIPFSHRKYS